MRNEWLEFNHIIFKTEQSTIITNQQILNEYGLKWPLETDNHNWATVINSSEICIRLDKASKIVNYLKKQMKTIVHNYKTGQKVRQMTQQLETKYFN